MIQYAVQFEILTNASEYWIPAFAGMTTVFVCATPSHKGRGKIRVRLA